MLRFLIITLLLGGCTTTTNVYVTKDASPPRLLSASPALGPFEGCASYLLPQLEKTPLFPLKPYAALSEEEDDQRIDLLIRYIEKLRKHIRDNQHQLNDSFAQYQLRCADEKHQKE